jgi:hypothetical protein
MCPLVAGEGQKDLEERLKGLGYVWDFGLTTVDRLPPFS